MNGFEGLIRDNRIIIKKLHVFNDYLAYVKNIIKKDEFYHNYITSLIQQRISQEGTDSEGVKLITDAAVLANSFGGSGHVYSPSNKQKSNMSHVDLNDTGYMLNSLDVVVDSSSIYLNVDIISNKDSSVYENFKISYKTEKEFKDVVFSLDKEEIDMLNQKLLERYLKELRAIFNYD